MKSMQGLGRETEEPKRVLEIHESEVRVVAMAASSSPPAVASSRQQSGEQRRGDAKREISKRKRREPKTQRDHHHHHHHERSKRHASSSDAAASSSSTSGSSSSSDDSSDSESSRSSSSSEEQYRRRRRASKRKHQHLRDESSSASDSDATERSRKHRRKDTSKKVKERRKESSKHKDKKHKRKEKSRKDGAGPVQLSKFLGREKDNGIRRSVVSGKKCLGVADTNEGGENQRRQIGRDKSHGASQVFELQLRLNDDALLVVVQKTAWICYLMARDAGTIRLCCLKDPLLDSRLLSFQMEILSLPNLPSALPPLALLLGLCCCFLCHSRNEGKSMEVFTAVWRLPLWLARFELVSVTSQSGSTLIWNQCHLNCV